MQKILWLGRTLFYGILACAAVAVIYAGRSNIPEIERTRAIVEALLSDLDQSVRNGELHAFVEKSRQAALSLFTSPDEAPGSPRVALEDERAVAERMVAALGGEPAENVPEPVPPSVPENCSVFTPDRAAAVSGDRLQVRVFERANGAQLGTVAGAAGAVFERLDLGGTYEVDDRGEVSLPLIGRANVLGLSLRCVEAVVSSRLFTALRSEVSTSATFSYRPPVVVTGAVRAPGAYTFLPGMTVAALLASAGARFDGGVADLRSAQELLDRVASLDRQLLGNALAIRRAEAELAASGALVLDDDLRRRVVRELGADRLASEEATLSAALAASLAADTATTATVEGFDRRIASASARLEETQKQLVRLRQRLDELRGLRDRGIASMTLIDEREVALMSVERERLANLTLVADLQVGKVQAIQDRFVAVAARREAQQRQIRDLRQLRDDLEAERASVQRQIARLSDTAMPDILDAGLSAWIQRTGPGGALVSISAGSSTRVAPGDVVWVGIGAPKASEVVASGAGPVLGGLDVASVTR